ncbi:unnamed protein product [Vicia faba]|uniref:Uncharacterized protein n=1 Tax=Vicia faba TaxID=3906 RepID=A0AAV1AEW5_VICFA|nr:unnamed protein product [Vicia faba]
MASGSNLGSSARFNDGLNLGKCQKLGHNCEKQKPEDKIWIPKATNEDAKVVVTGDQELKTIVPVEELPPVVMQQAESQGKKSHVQRYISSIKKGERSGYMFQAVEKIKVMGKRDQIHKLQTLWAGMLAAGKFSMKGVYSQLRREDSVVN